jgi:hypothetical protein
MKRKPHEYEIEFSSYVDQHLAMCTSTDMRWMQYLHHSALFNNGLELFSIVGFPWLHHTQSSADVTIETKACTLW